MGLGLGSPQAAPAISSVGLELLKVRAERIGLYLFLAQNGKDILI